MFGIDDALILGGASIIGGMMTNETNEDISSAQSGFNAEQAALNRDFNANEAAKSREYNTLRGDYLNEWNLNVANTSYQRAVKDMQAAGLNPMLAYSRGGAATPQASVGGVAQASGQAATSAAPPHIRNVLGDAISTALTTAQIQAQTALTEAQTKKTTAETWTELRRPENISADTDLKRSGIGLNEQTARLNMFSANRVAEEIPKIQAETKNAVQQLELLKAQTGTEAARTMLTKAQEYLTRLEAQFTEGKIGIQKFTLKIEEAESMIRNSGVFGAAEEQKFQAVWGQVQRILKTLNPLSGLAR